MAEANRLAAALRYQQGMALPTPEPDSMVGRALDAAAQWGRGVQKNVSDLVSPTAWAEALKNPPRGVLSQMNPENKQEMINQGIDSALNFGPGVLGTVRAVGGKLMAAPQAEALRLAQQRAALPVDQGGLGLPAGNTPQQRAAAMGFDTDVYHGTTMDFNKFAGRLPTYAAEEPRIADIYANATTRHMSLNRPINAGPNIMPLKLGGKELTISDLGEGGGGWLSDNLAKALGIPRTRTLINELPNYGIDRLKVTDMGDLGGVQTQHMIPLGSDNIRSRFAAFDPFRRNAAVAAAMGVAAPDLLAQENK
jgi:hypothetical protein